jgi:hypothetical protein
MGIWPQRPISLNPFTDHQPVVIVDLEGDNEVLFLVATHATGEVIENK